MRLPVGVVDRDHSPEQTESAVGRDEMKHMMWLDLMNTPIPSRQLVEFLGVLPSNGCDRCGGDWPMAIVRVDNGLVLKEVHLSRLSEVQIETPIC